MESPRIAVSALIDAPAEDLYRIIADYRDGHPRILPRPPFVDLQVEQGGTGSGTVIRVEMRVLGRVQTFRSVVSEPEPGRVLVESNDTGYVTTFTVEPRGEGRAEVTIATELTGRGGPLRAIERWFSFRLLEPVYRRELEQLAEVATAPAV
jgi:hypothetical protein